MFQMLKAGHKLGAIGAKWVGATGVDPGDNGQVAKVASQYVSQRLMEPEDAWLMAMTNWMSGMPWPDSKLMLAQAMLQFLDVYEGKVALSAVTILNARQTAQEIVSNALSHGSGA
jgi:hypothetical protein